MKRVICALMTVIAVFLASCSSAPSADKTAATKKEANEQSITIYSLKDDTLCPILTDNDANRQMLFIVYESLVRLKTNMEAEGALATSWSVSDDGLKWSFKIRDGVKWHSGETLTPQDVVYTVEQIKKNVGSCYEHNVRHITEVAAQGDSVVFTLSTPCANFVNLMTFPIIKQQPNDIDRAYFVPNGTGAYIFSDKNEGNMYYLLKNNSWWGGEAKLDEIKVRLLPDSETVMYSLSAGDIDIANTERGQMGKFISNADVKTKSCPMSVYDFVGINHKNVVLSQKEVRQAMDKAVNRRKIVNDIFAGNGSEAKSPIRRNWFMYGEEKENFNTTGEDAERILLKEGWKKTDGVYRKKIDKTNYRLEFDLLVNEDNSNRMNIAESVRLDLEGAGFAVNVIPLPYEEYEARILSGDYELFIGSIMISEEVDFTSFLGEGNMFFYEGKALSALIANTQVQTTKTGIIESYGAFRKKFNSELPLIGLCFENFDMLIKRNIGGSLLTSQSNMYDGIYNLYIEEE